MENETRCPLQLALLRVQLSAKTTRDLVNTFYILQKTISNLLDHPADWRCTVTGSDTEPFVRNLFHRDEVKQFLLLIGFREANGTYEFIVCDEGMKALEAGLKALDTTIHNLKIAFIEERPYFELWKDGHYLKNSRALTNTNIHCAKVVETKSRHAKLEGLLARHLKQDVFERVALVNRKKREIPDASFNSEGYFYQACQNRESKKRRRFYEEMFDKHDSINHKKNFAFFPSLKLG